MTSHREPADFPILMCENVLDLLVVAIAPELDRWIADNPYEPGLAYRQALVAFVLDSVRPGALEELAAQRRKAGWE